MAVAIPAYKDYVLRARLGDAFAALAGAQLDAEQYWASNKTYANVGALSLPAPAASSNFNYAYSSLTASTFTLTATGKASTLGFVYTVDQSGNRATTGVPSGYTANGACWVDRKGGQCTQ
jgi:type IV pilus assembly protein PilE